MDNMTKKVTYICDVCGAESEKPFKLHLVANLGSKSGPETTLYADVCKAECAVKFAQNAAHKVNLYEQDCQQQPDPIQVAS